MNYEECQERVVAGLIHHGLVNFGSYRWNIHERHPELQRAPFYINLHKAQSCTVTHGGHSLLGDITELYALNLERHRVTADIIAGIPVAAIPITLSLAILLGKPHITPRSPKTHGSGEPIDGIWSVGQTAVLGDDVMNAGGSKIPAFFTLRENGIIVQHIIVLIDYEAGGRDLLWRTYRLRTISCLSVRQIMNRARDLRIISAKERSEALNFNRLVRGVVQQDSQRQTP